IGDGGQIATRKKMHQGVHQFTQPEHAIARRHPVGNHQMNVLTRSVVEAKLKITREELIFRRIAAWRENQVAAIIRKFEADDMPLAGAAILPACLYIWVGGAARHDGAVVDIARYQVLGRDRDE